jgi:hypothetical protein
MHIHTGHTGSPSAKRLALATALACSLVSASPPLFRRAPTPAVIVALASASLPFAPTSTTALSAAVFALFGSWTSTSTQSAAAAVATAAAVLALFGALTAVVDVLAVLAAELRAVAVTAPIRVATSPPTPIALMGLSSVLSVRW